MPSKQEEVLSDYVLSKTDVTGRFFVKQSVKNELCLSLDSLEKSEAKV